MGSGFGGHGCRRGEAVDGEHAVSNESITAYERVRYQQDSPMGIKRFRGYLRSALPLSDKICADYSSSTLKFDVKLVSVT